MYNNSLTFKYLYTEQQQLRTRITLNKYYIISMSIMPLQTKLGKFSLYQPTQISNFLISFTFDFSTYC